MRRRALIYGLAFWAFLVLGTRGAAQYKFEKAEQFTDEDGLPGNVIRFIKKGADGFVWIGTTDGLCRFDGAQFKVYQYDPDNPNSIIDNRVVCMAVDTHELWIGTHIGLSRFNLAAEKFTHYQFDEKGRRESIQRIDGQQIHSLLKDRNGDLWVGTRYQGVARYLPETDDFKMYRGSQNEVARFFPDPKSIHNILSLEQHRSNDSIIWAGTSTGVLEINKYTHEVEWLAFNLEIPVEKRWGNIFKTMYHHSDGLVYTGNWGGGLTVFDPERRFVKMMEVASHSGETVMRAGTHKMVEKSDAEFWVTTSSGLALYHSGKKEATFHKVNSEEVTYGVEFVDEQHRAWAKSAQGVFVFDPLLQQFDAYSFNHLDEPGAGLVFNIVEWKRPDGLIVVPRTSPGVFHFNRKSRSWENARAPDALLDDKGLLHTRHAVWSPGGELTLCYFGGIILYHPEKRSFRPFPSLPPLKLKRFHCMLWDSRGRLWVATFDEGICRWDPRTGRWHVFREELRSQAPGLLSMSFDYLMEDSRGNIWFKREQGFGVYLSAKDSFIQFNYSQYPDRCFPHINNLVEDKKGRVWMNSLDGLIGYAEVAHPEKGVVWQMDMNKLPNIYVKGIWSLRAGPNGDIWGCGEKALTHIDGEGLSVTQYDFKYGGDKGGYLTFEILSDGALIFGGKNRIIFAEPGELRYNREAPQPYLTGINVLEESFQGEAGPIFLKELRLKHWQNFFSFDFSARGFTFGKQNKFRYRLKDFDENWIMAKGRRNANYTNVPSGEYLFQLQAANNEGVWNEQLYELPVYIASPWWGRWWFIAGALALTTLLGYRLYRYRIGQIRKEEKLKAEFEKRLADVEMSALRAQMNPHFLFNCLNSIDSYIIKNETRKASEYLNNFARLIRLILQNSRANYVSLKDEVEAIELYLQMENLRFRDKFAYEIRIDENVDPSAVDIPPMLIQPYVENAIWHGLMHKEDKSRGMVIFSISRENGFLKCAVQDNGIGREKPRELKAKRPLRGQQSYGMRITNDRINLINKLYNSNTTVQVIDLKDEQQNPLGTRVELCIPV